MDATQQTTIGNDVSVKFVSLGGRSIQGKVDTGATTSSLHAERITIDKANNQVSFNCSELSTNTITMPLAGSQEVHTADAGGETRPTVEFDVEIAGVRLSRTLFNLNDRSNMDMAILVGQNVLKAGNFVIDVNADEPDDQRDSVPEQASTLVSDQDKVLEALTTLAESGITLRELLTYMQTIAVSSIKE